MISTIQVSVRVCLFVCWSVLCVCCVGVCVIWALFPPGPRALPPAGKLPRHVFRGERGGWSLLFAVFGLAFDLGFSILVLGRSCAGGVSMREAGYEALEGS